MTPEGLTLLGLLLIEARNWIEHTDPGSLDAALLDAAVDAVARARKALVGEVAR
jgi:hypothetical protein